MWVVFCSSSHLGPWFSSSFRYCCGNREKSEIKNGPGKTKKKERNEAGSGGNVKKQRGQNQERVDWNCQRYSDGDKIL